MLVLSTVRLPSDCGANVAPRTFTFAFKLDCSTVLSAVFILLMRKEFLGSKWLILDILFLFWFSSLIFIKVLVESCPLSGEFICLDLRF